MIMAYKLWPSIKGDLTRMSYWGTPNISIFSLFSLGGQIPLPRGYKPFCLFWACGGKKGEEEEQISTFIIQLSFNLHVFKHSLPSTWDSSLQFLSFMLCRKSLVFCQVALGSHLLCGMGYESVLHISTT